MSWDEDDDDRYVYRENTTNYKIIMFISFGICLLICLIVFCCCLFKKRRREGIVRSTAANPPNVVVAYPQSGTAPQPCNNIQQLTDVNGTFYKVPFSALPPNFDYSSSQIEVRADHVILRDLSLLQTLQVSNTITAPTNDYPPAYVGTEAYSKPTPYNPGYGAR